MWIGATNLNGPMTWVDGKPLSYTSWAGGQPASSKNICLMRLHYYIVLYISMGRTFHELQYKHNILFPLF
jgi:hypothetical protein